MPSPFRFDRTWEFPVPTSELWAQLADTDRYPRWWSWLRRFDAEGLVAGTTAHCVVRAPLPYSLNFDVHVVEVVPERLVEARVSGDLTGPARLELDGDGERTVARLAWEVEPCAPLLRVGARVSRPVMEWGHNWVVETGVRQFRRRALRR